MEIDGLTLQENEQAETLTHQIDAAVGEGRHALATRLRAQRMRIMEGVTARLGASDG